MLELWTSNQKVIRGIPIGEEGSQLNVSNLVLAKMWRMIGGHETGKKMTCRRYFAVVVVQLPSRVQLLVTPWTAPCPGLPVLTI